MSRRQSHSMQHAAPIPTAQTYQSLASLCNKLQSSKVTERRAASKELLEKLQDIGTLRRLESEAAISYDSAMARYSSSNRSDKSDPQVLLPWDRVCHLYRSLLDAALLKSRTLIDGGGETTTKSKKRTHANQTGFTKKSIKYTAEDVLFPYKVFLKMDLDQTLDVNDGGYGGTNISWDQDWKTKPRYGHHLDIHSLSATAQNERNHGRYSATHYTPHDYTDRNRGSRLTAKEILGCVDYILLCLNNDDCCNYCEVQLLHWLVYICSRPEYLCHLPVQGQLSYVLHELSTRLNRAFVEGHVEERGILPSGKSIHRRGAISQECLLAVSKCLSSIVYNCTTRLGMGMHLFIRPVIDTVAAWAENAWQLQSQGEFANSSTEIMMHPKTIVSKAKNPHSAMVEEGQISASTLQRKLRSEADLLALLPYLYSSVTHMLSAHPEQSIPILSDHGHVLLRLARKNYPRPTTNLQTRDALIEYLSAHLLVAETSGKICGLPEGDLGPLIPRENDDEEGQQEERKEEEEEEEEEEIPKQIAVKKKNKKNATLDANTISKLLEMIRSDKVWETLFSSSASGQNAKRKKSRTSVSGRKRGRSSGGVSLPEGGSTWMPMTRRQRRHLELMARLVRVSQRLYIAEAEDQGNGTVDTFDSLVSHAEDMIQSSGIEQGEIDIQPRDSSSQQQFTLCDVDESHEAAPTALACSPWIRMVCRHLYKLNPKLGRLVPSEADNSLTQGMTQGSTQFYTQTFPSSETNNVRMGSKDDGMTSCERILLESCPMLQALVVDQNTLIEESSTSAENHQTQGTLTATLTAPTTNQTNKDANFLDTVKPTTKATLQFLAACAEAFPRGECWASSTRQNWSTILDEGTYPSKTLANILERHGSSPSDAAAIIYLLGTTLECQGGSGGDSDIQLWTMVTLLKMTESSAIICSREGLSDPASFGSASSLTPLRLAWQYVWKILFRYDLRYSPFTSGAFGNNVGELVVQLLTQIVRNQCVDRKCLFVCRPPPTTVQTSSDLLATTSTVSSVLEKSPFVHKEQSQLWKLPMFEDPSSILSGAPFELITSVIQYAGFSDISDSNTTTMQMSSIKDRRWFVSFCLRFTELAMNDNADSSIRRTYLPLAATCLASLISDGIITSNVSTFELDGLTRFGITEDVEPLRFVYDPDKVEIVSKMGISTFYSSLWAESATPNDYLKGMNRGLALRIIQGRGAFLNRFSDAHYEREQLRGYMNQSTRITDTGMSPQRSSLGDSSFDAVKSYLDEVMFQLKYDDGNASDEEQGLGLGEKESAVKGVTNLSLQLPQLTGCLSLLLTTLLSKHTTVEDISTDVCNLFGATFGSAFDLLIENMPSLKNHPADLLVVFNHLHGIVRVLTFIASFGGGNIPHLFGNQAKGLFSVCKKLLKEHRNEACTSGTSNQAAATMSRRGFDDSDSDEEHVSSRPQTYPTQTQRSAFSDDSDDGLMDDDEDDERVNQRARKQKAPPVKRRRMGNNVSKSKARKDSTRDNNLMDSAMDNVGAWSCSSFILLLQPSMQSVEVISGHLVWPEDYDSHVGYGTVSKTPDPAGYLVCASLFCQKSVLLRRDRLDMQSDREDDQESPLVIIVEALLQARRKISPSSKYFMSGLGIVADMVKTVEYGENSEPIQEIESKAFLEVLYPLGIGKENDDYFMLKQLNKKHLKHRMAYRSEQLRAATQSFLCCGKNLREEFNNVYGPYFILSSFCHIDENVRTLACDVLGSAMIRFPDQGTIVSDTLKSAIPRLDNRKKFMKWIDKSMVDQKIPEDMKDLEDIALTDIEGSIVYHSIECIGLIAGYANDPHLAKDMIWKLIDLATNKPSLLLPCYRACKRAAFLREYNGISGMFNDMMPHLLVRWLESRRRIHDFPLLLVSPYALDRVCRYLPNEMLSMLLSGGGWNEDFFLNGNIEEEHTLTEKLLESFLGTVTKFLIPNILLASTDAQANNENGNDRIDSSKYLNECVRILTHAESDNNVAIVLTKHVSDLYAYVAVLTENGEATLECENAFKHLKRCVSTVQIERTGAKSAFLVLRQILLLHLKGIAVVGLGDVELNSGSFLTGIKFVAKQLKTSSSKSKQASYLEQLNSSMTESIVLVKYWLSSSQTTRQREESWGTFSLLCDILTENIKTGKIQSGELNFCLNSFIGVLLDPQNNVICPIVLNTLKFVLKALFEKTTKEALVEGSITVLHKLSLALLQTHQRAYEKLYTTCDSALCCLEYEQKSSQGLLSGFEGASKQWDSLGEAPWGAAPNRDAVLKHLVRSKASIEEKEASDIMLGAYECLEIIATSGTMELDGILGAEDIVLQCSHKEEVFRSVNERYSLLTFFNSIQQKSTKETDTNLNNLECEHFIRITNEHPIQVISDSFDSAASNSSHDVLARLLALQRLERVLLQDESAVATTSEKNQEEVYRLLLEICHSNEPETSRVISSRCLGELKIDNLTNTSELPSESDDDDDNIKDDLDDPILGTKKNVLTMLGQYLLSECADTALIAMKTAKSLLVTPMGKETWQSLGEGDIAVILSPFNTQDDGKLRKEAVKVSSSCLERLKSSSTSQNSDSWCWDDRLWTCLDSDETSCDLWMRNITSAIISCCFDKKGSKVGKSDQEFFRMCQGLCAKEASFAAKLFPALIFHLLDSEGSQEGSDICIGSPTSEMNKVITRCFSRILRPTSNTHGEVAPQAITVILNTLELLRSITEHRFKVASSYYKANNKHLKNTIKQSASLSKSKKTCSKKRDKSSDHTTSDCVDIDISSIGESPKWRGVPYGVVLRVSGLDVAAANFRVKRYYSALYYAEMSMNNLIGTGTFFEDLADSHFKQNDASVQDISGFGTLLQQDGEEKVLEQALLAKDMISRCLSELYSQDELQGVLSQGSALNLKRNITSLSTLEGCRRDQTFSMLVDIDNGLQTSSSAIAETRNPRGERGLSTIASCLEDLGLNHIKHNYLAGVEHQLNKDNTNRHYLREKWFEDSLNQTLKWDDTLLPQMNVNDGEQLPGSQQAANDSPPSYALQPMATYYESVYDAIQSFSRNDTSGGLGCVLQARKSVLSDMEYLAGSEAQSKGMVNHITKLNSLGRLELLGKTLGDESNLPFLLNRWGFSQETSTEASLESRLLNDDVNFDMQGQAVDIEGELFRSIRTGLSVEELSLKVLTNKFASNKDGEGEGGVSLSNALTSHIYKSCSIYRELGHPDAAKISLSSLRSLVQVLHKSGIVDHSSGKLPLMLRLEDAKIMKSQNDLDGAIMHCKMIANFLDGSSTKNSIDVERDQIRSESLLLGGMWMRQNNVDSTETILSSFFEKAAGLAVKTQKKAPTPANIHRASMSSFKLGEFASTLYNAIEARTSSDAWKRRIVAANERKRELKEIKEQERKARQSEAKHEYQILHSTLSKEVAMDDQEIQSVEASIQRYLHLAVDSYCNALKLCPTSVTDVSKHVFQLVSLWFKNCHQKETGDIVNRLIKANLSHIPSYRLVPLIYQLFSRIDEAQDGDDNGFQDTLRQVVLKVCQDHPYHGIVQILALSNGQRVGGGVNGRHANAYLENVGTAKVDAVNNVIQELRKQAPDYVSALIDSYQTLMTSYMNVAELPTPEKMQKCKTNLWTFKEKKLDLDTCLSAGGGGGGGGGGRRGKKNIVSAATTSNNMPVIITSPPLIRPDCEYGNGKEDPIGSERVVGFEPTFKLTTSGIHRPKIVNCIGSKGTRFKQLVKGEDDMRQDAIMQQVFGTVNDLFRHEENDFIKKNLGSYISGTRQLRLITYGITPLSPTSGVLEWVDNTMAFGDYIQDGKGKGRTGSHSKYYPGEWGDSDARTYYHSLRRDKDNHIREDATPESIRQGYDILSENFSPSFRFFFLEYFNSSMEAWHTARTKYTRSCAVSSIVGHILGIGDRHTSNIMVHTKTGEIVHIDFGIVFEQGKTLQTPELVPFRLTRDIVDGMGPTDGAFSKAAEATMGVLRNNADTLLTILSAVVSDPLYKWSLSPMKANQHQRNDDEDDDNGSTNTKLSMPNAWMAPTSEDRNDTADRAIAKIHEKLEGYEDGTSGEHKTVAGQVKLLINEARDPDNLSMMFAGWASWI